MGSLRKAEKNLQSILDQIDRLSSLAKDPEVAEMKVESVSGWSIAEQMEHLVLAGRNTLKALDRMVEGSLDSQGSGLSAVGRLVLGLQYIPRGRAQAPERARPQGLELSEIASGFEEVRQGFLDWGPRLCELEQCRATCPHHLLGHFSALQWLKFTKVHQHHHWKIVRDIRKAAEARAQTGSVSSS